MKITYTVRDASRKLLGTFKTLKEAREWCERFDPFALIYTKVED